MGLSPGGSNESGERPATPMRRAFRVLLAEDDEDFRAVLTRLLTREGYVVIQAEDGDAMLDLLVNSFSPDADRTLAYDAIVTDIMMPGFSGLDVLQAFRRSTASAALVVMSAFDDQRFARTAQALGAVAFFLKPFDTDQLLEALARALSPPLESRRSWPPPKPAAQS
jgi:two-component system response regulator (stage 0 sporulation protein F)